MSREDSSEKGECEALKVSGREYKCPRLPLSSPGLVPSGPLLCAVSSHSHPTLVSLQCDFPSQFAFLS